MAHLRFGAALWGDAVSYLGQVVVVVLLESRGGLSPKSAFVAMATTSVIAGILQAAQVGISFPSAAEMSGMLSVFWNLGRWLLLNGFVGVFSVQLFPWLLGSLRSVADAGVFQALVNTVGVANPIVISCVNWIMPTSAKAERESGRKAATKTAVRSGLLGALIILPYFVVVLLWPTQVLSLLYGPSTPYLGFKIGLRLLVGGYAVNYLAVVVSTLLNAIEQSQITFLALLVSAFVSFLAGAPLVAWMGVLGAATAMVVSTLARTGVLLVSARRQGFNVQCERPQYQELL
jgi:O-antigen/teichoic acid export membrane protein